jgi:hypothetical protein
MIRAGHVSFLHMKTPDAFTGVLSIFEAFQVRDEVTRSSSLLTVMSIGQPPIQL